MEDYSVIALRPQRIKQGQCFDKAEYEIVRNSILKHLLAYGAMTVDKLGLYVENHLNDKLVGRLFKHYEAVRHVLEARGEIRCISKTHPQLIEIAD